MLSIILIMRWRDINLVLMKVMTILISTMTMMSKVSLGCSFSYFVFYFDFWMSRRLECAIGKDDFFKII